MDQEKWQEFKADFPLLIEAGFVAVKQLDEISARRLFHAAQLINPESTAPQIGLGYIALNKLEIREAIEIFRQVVELEPENHLAQTFLGISYLFSRKERDKGIALIKKTIKETKDETIINLGTVALDWAESDLKKIKKPIFID